jgi:hypothetical protein
MPDCLSSGGMTDNGPSMSCIVGPFSFLRISMLIVFWLWRSVCAARSALCRVGDEESVVCQYSTFVRCMERLALGQKIC